MSPVIDTHTHFLPRPFLEEAKADPDGYQIDVVEKEDGYYLEPRFWSLARFIEYGPFRPEHYDWGTRIEHMDASGVDVQVLSCVQSLNYSWAPLDLALEVARIANDEMAKAIEQNPGRFQGIASVPTQDPVAAASELSRAVGELGLTGVQLLSNIDGRNPEDSGLDPLFAYAEAKRIPVFVHPYGDLNPDRLGRNFLVNLIGWPSEQALAMAGLIFDGVLDRFPRLRFHLGHGGGTFLFTLGRLRRGLKAIEGLHGLLQRDFDEYLDNVYVDALLHDERAIEYVIDVLGPDHVFFGTDWPFWMQDPLMLERIRAMPIDASTRERILGGNAELFYIRNSRRWAPGTVGARPERHVGRGEI